jgi:hypothetical protein
VRQQYHINAVSLYREPISTCKDIDATGVILGRIATRLTRLVDNNTVSNAAFDHQIRINDASQLYQVITEQVWKNEIQFTALQFKQALAQILTIPVAHASPYVGGGICVLS